MSIWYPSALVRLIVRLDEPGLDKGAIATPSVPKALAQTSGGRAEAVQLPGPTDPYSLVVGVVPLRASISMGSVREPDEATLTIDANYLPLDPRMVRQLACDIYLGAVEPSAFGEGMLAGDPVRSTVEASEQTWRFVGWADEGSWALHAGEFTAQFRGLKSLLTDAKIHPEVLEQLDVGRPIHEVIRDLVDTNPMSAGMRVVVRGLSSAGQAPNLQDVLPSNFKRRKTGTYHLPAEDAGESYWETILRICQLVGWVASVELSTVVLQPARTLWRGLAEAEIPQYDARSQELSSVPAFRRQVGSQTLTSRRFIYGLNVEALEFTRPWHEASRRVLEVRAHVPGKRGVLVARYPPQATAAKTSAKSSGPKTEEIDVMVVYGITTEEQAQEVARQSWHARAMRDLRGMLRTKDLASWGGTPQDSDVLSLKGGDTIEVLVALAEQGGSTPEQVANLGNARMVERLRARNLDAATAQKWSAALMQGLPSQFRVSKVTHDWSAESGYSAAVEFEAYLNARLEEAQP